MFDLVPCVKMGRGWMTAQISVTLRSTEPGSIRGQVQFGAAVAYAR